ncbi:hypothetical protein KEM56_006009 [Ascosphaera pollenicola]|nr:hypothetical protein KEM56_006009 [Ascosphaera pollenicola]
MLRLGLMALLLRLAAEPDSTYDDHSGQFWTLDDYVVEVGGSECLHFMEVDGILREEDEVVIRPLQPQEVRARRLTGRRQITAYGTHLIDGIPFGSKFRLGALGMRPPVRIPPRKDRRLMYDDLADGNDQNSDYDAQQYLQEDEKESEEDDVDYQQDQDDMDLESEEGEEALMIENGDAPETMSSEIPQQGEPLNMPLKPALKRAVPQEPLAQSTSQRDQTQTRGQASRVGFIDETIMNIPAKTQQKTVEKNGAKADDASKPSRAKTNRPIVISSDPEESDSDTSVSSSVASDSAESSSSAESDSDSSSAEESESEAEDILNRTDYVAPVTRARANGVTPEPPKKQSFTPPGAGSRVTKYGNTRSRMRRKLNRLKAVGLLDEKAKFDDLRRWEEENPNGHWKLALAPELENGVNRKEKSKEQQQPEEKVKAIADELAEVRAERAKLARAAAKASEVGVGAKRKTQQQEETTAKAAADEQAEFEARRAKLLKEIQTGGIDVDKKFSKLESSSESSSSSSSDSSSDEDDAPETQPIQKKPAATFMPAPRSVQLGKSSKPAQPAVAKQPAPSQPTESPDFWKSKLTVGATECVYDHIMLQPPPFPFKQRWDKEAGHAIFSEMNGAQNQNESQGKGKRKRGNRDTEGQPVTKKADIAKEPEDTALDYGEDIVANKEDNPAARPLAQDSPRSNSDEDNFPPLPKDVSTLTPLRREHLKLDAIIAFKRMEITSDTNWLPNVSRRFYTARIIELEGTRDGDIEVTMRLAKRDQAQSDKDKEGSVWDAFEVPVSDSDEEERDLGIYASRFSVLIEPKLLVPAGGK